MIDKNPYVYVPIALIFILSAPFIIYFVATEDGVVVDFFVFAYFTSLVSVAVGHLVKMFIESKERRMVCPGCSGSGEVEVTVVDERYPCYGANDPNCVTYTYYVECPICDGAGKVSSSDENWEKAVKLNAMRKAGKNVEADEIVHAMAISRDYPYY